MPVKPAKPVEIIAKKDADDFRILEMRFDMSDAQNPCVDLHLSAGIQPVGGEYQQEKEWWFRVPAEDFIAATSSGQGRVVYDGLKNLLYTYLQTKGIFPAGNIT
jgi:hypothetical protein